MTKATIALIGLLSLLAPSVLRAGDAAPASAPSPEELARQMIQVTGGGSMAKQVMSRMIEAFRARDPALPQAFWTEFEASIDEKELEELVVPIYVKNLTADEMTAAIQFYSSPLGQSLVKKLPAIVEESMKVGGAWGQALAAKAYDRIKQYKQSHSDA